MSNRDSAELSTIMEATEPCEYHQYCKQRGWLNTRYGKVFCPLHDPDPSTPNQAQQLFRQLLNDGHERFDHAVFSGLFLVGATAVPQSLYFNGAVFHHDAVFEMTRFGGKVHLHGVEIGGRLRFRAAKLEGGLSVSNSVVGGDLELFDADVKARTDLVGVRIGGSLDFGNATLGAVEISHARVGGRLSLAGSTFSDDLQAFRADVQDETRLNGTSFGAQASFREAVFRSTVEARATVFSGTAEFGDARFVDGAQFVNAEFRAETSFTGAVFEGATVFSGYPSARIFQGVDLHFDGVHVVNADELAFRDADLARAQLANTDLRDVELTGVRWPRLGGRRLGKRLGLYDETLVGTSGEAPSFDAVERSYRELKHGYEERKDYARAGDFHFGEKEMRLRNPSTPFGDRALLAVYWLVSHYGERVWLPLTWLVVLVLGSATAYLCHGAVVSIGGADVPAALDAGSPADWGRSVLYSLRSSVLLRPGGAVPGGWLGFLNTSQRILGPILLALAALAVRQRLRR